MGLRAAFRKHSYGKKAFKLAAEGNFRDALALIDKGGDIHYRADYYYSFVIPCQTNCNIGFIALEKNNTQALEALLQRGLDPNKHMNKNPDHLPLHFAIMKRNQQAVDLLVKAGARTDVTLGNMQTMREHAEKNRINLPAQQASEKPQPGSKL